VYRRGSGFIEQFSDFGGDSLKRLMMVLESMETLYEAVCTLDAGVSSTSDLLVVACDSGSDKVFDFTGISRILEKVESILVGAWDRIVFYRERQFAERIKLVTSTLPILEELSQLEKNRSLSREDVEIIRRKITKGVSQFLETGGRIPAMEERAQFEPAKLLQASETLLLPPPDETSSKAAEEHPTPRIRVRRSGTRQASARQRRRPQSATSTR
jgi:hypothetical protein